MWRTLQNRYDALATAVAQLDVIDLVALATGLVMIRNSHGGFYLVLALAAIAAMVCWVEVRRSPWFWLSLAALWIPRLTLRWYENEDHIFFGVYWFAAIGLAMWGCQQREVLARSARVLIGLSFGFAFAWKIMVPQFYDASLFHYKLLYDYRFRQLVTEPLGQLPQVATDKNIQSIRDLHASVSQPTVVPIEVPARVTLLAGAMTTWTIAIEGILAALFLLPATRLTNAWRDISLIFFMISTYIVVPVLGFATIFTAMGFAQDQSKNGRIRLAYGVTLLLLSVWLPVRVWLFPPIA